MARFAGTLAYGLLPCASFSAATRYDKKSIGPCPRLCASHAMASWDTARRVNSNQGHTIRNRDRPVVTVFVCNRPQPILRTSGPQRERWSQSIAELMRDSIRRETVESPKTRSSVTVRFHNLVPEADPRHVRTKPCLCIVSSGLRSDVAGSAETL